MERVRFRAERDVMLSALAIVRDERVTIRHFLDTVAVSSVDGEVTYISITVGGEYEGAFECNRGFLAAAIRTLQDPKLAVTAFLGETVMIHCSAGDRTVMVWEHPCT